MRAYGQEVSSSLHFIVLLRGILTDLCMFLAALAIVLLSTVVLQAGNAASQGEQFDGAYSAGWDDEEEEEEEEEDDCDPAHCTKVVAPRIDCPDGAICVRGGIGVPVPAEPWYVPGGRNGNNGGGGSNPVEEEPLDISINCWQEMVAGSAVISSPFGPPRARGPHKGIDIDVPTGTSVFAARQGIVTDIMSDELPVPDGATSLKGYTSTGNRVYINYSDGETGRYLHLKTGSVNIAPGTRVDPGQYIAQSNETGLGITGPHLHYDHQAGGSFIDPQQEFDCS